ncbi:MAG: ATP-dependent DNA helicase RecQ [Candidatus Ordinivivax streblomastigis]|uniref:ATP-dependent DNA helicase RecQ n=1 Tax=Candidatus Ordinivivax streblomastigis TaxID=2540710 RepID=A0A5M8P0X4_9BACT|nr:MAG: ATP-dependent DNA helicase RecQ [Candidatus Ordinivivax streblomastigis]
MNSFRDILKQYWGYDSFRSLQEEIIASVYEGNDTLGLMPTGGGKSLTFQVPALLMDGICIVITPLIALMKDQVDALRQKGIKAAMVHSGMSHREIRIALDNCIFGDYKFLYVSPERIGTELFIAKLKDMNISLIAVDESHCISQWGYDFRPSYLRISELRDLLPQAPVLALTATATPEVIDDIQEKLFFKKKNVFRKSFERKNIAYVIRETDDKLFEIIKILNNVPGSGIVYVRSRRRTKEIAEELQKQGIDADFFHAGLTTDEKIRKQNNWKSGQCRIIVCTNAFGMGIDKPDVRVVIHFELPNSLEEYFQEAGRAGRDEQKSYAVALYSARDGAQLKKRIKDEFPEKDFIKDVYEKLAYFYEIGMGMGINSGHNFVIEQFCATYHYNITHVHSALKLLDLSGYIEYLEETEKQSKLIFTVKREELYHLHGITPDLDNLLQVVLRSYTGLFSDYAYISETLLAQRTGLTPHEVYEGLKNLSQQYIIHYVPAKKVPTIYYLQNREQLKYLYLPANVYEERKKRLLERIRSVYEYGSSKTCCRSKLLLSYFGEKDTDACGHCDVCLEEKKKNKTKMARFLADK